MSRFQKIAEKLASYGLDAMMITSEPNRLYAAQFHSTAGVALVTWEKSWFFTDSRYMEAARKQIDGAELRLNTTDVTLNDLTNQVIQAQGIQKLGFEDQYATVAEYNVWKEKLACRDLVPASGLLSELRMVKDEEEIGHIRDAQAITDKSFSEMLDVIKAGMTERQVAAELEYRLKKNGADGLAFATIAVAGPNSSMPHGVPGDRPLQAGDFLTLDFGAASAGYCSDMTRTVAIGHVTEEMEKVYNLVLEAQLASIAKIAPGVPCVEVDAAARDLIYGAGYEGCFGHGTGHSLGLQIHEDPRFSTTAGEAVCQPGIVMSVEPGVYLSGRFGCRIEDIVLITPEGCQDLTHSPKELLIL